MTTNLRHGLVGHSGLRPSPDPSLSRRDPTASLTVKDSAKTRRKVGSKEDVDGPDDPEKAGRRSLIIGTPDESRREVETKGDN